MKIDESAVRLDARHELSQQYRVDAESSYSFRGVLQELRAPAAVAATRADDEGGRVQRMLQQLVATMLEMLTGENCRCRVADVAAPATPPAAASPRLRTMEWQTRVVEHIAEREQTAFSAAGQVRTADGRQIAFDLSLAMCREFTCTREYQESGRVEFRDPLVINYDGKAADLTDLRFDFDLDADGRSESLPVLARGSGYLALDANHDGRINDGRELFGALSGNGFDDLRQFDADANGWLDDADPAFAALGVWFPDGQLQPLKETGVGALHLASAWTPFALNDADNKARGQVSRSGVYLAEDGGVGTLQQIDLAVAAPAAKEGAASPAAAGTSV